MIDLWSNLYLIYGILGLSTFAVDANVITTKSVDCECFNTTTNANSQDVCRDNVVRCYNTDSDRLPACFVLWATDNLTGIVFVVVLLFSNCFIRRIITMIIVCVGFRRNACQNEGLLFGQCVHKHRMR